MDKLLAILDVFDEHISTHEFPIMRLIVSINRTWEISRARSALSFALALRERGVIALDFCDDPKKGEFSKYAEIFSAGLNEGLPFTCHFAEGPGETDLEDILQANPSRLGHATYMPEDIAKKVLERRIPIETCFVSNINTMKLYDGLKKGGHPFAMWYEARHPLVLCTDNPGILKNSSLSEHYSLAQKEYGLTELQIWELSKQTIEYIFEGDEVKQKLRGYFASFESTNSFST